MSNMKIRKSEMMEKIKLAMKDVKMADPTSRVYKEECLVSTDDLESPGGLFVNLNTFEAFGEEFVKWDAERSGNILYLHIQTERKYPSSSFLVSSNNGDGRNCNDEEAERRSREGKGEEKTTAICTNGEETAKPKKLAIGKEGGFDVNDLGYELEETYEVVVFPEDFRIDLKSEELPMKVAEACRSIIEHTGNFRMDEVDAWEEEIKPSRYSQSLKQIENPPKIPPSGWKCAVCGATANLWLNLSDGYIGCGRKIYSVGGGCSNGEEGAALTHFNDCHRDCPLVVKLGTITPHSADVFSYAADENDCVEDPKLSKHLAHFGINIQEMTKTEKTTTELEIDRNVNFDWNRVTEADQQLQPLRGPGFVGLKNLGNSCFINSVVQLLCALEPTRQKFVENFEEILHSLPAGKCAADDFWIQWSKLAIGILTDRHIKQWKKRNEKYAAEIEMLKLRNKFGEEENDFVTPRMFRRLVGRGHPEFASTRQQDAEEYFSYLLELFARNERTLKTRCPNTSAAAQGCPFSHHLRFQVEQRLQCCQSKQVRYSSTPMYFLGLSIPLEAAENIEDVREYQQRQQKRQKISTAENGALSSTQSIGEEEDPVRHVVAFRDCLLSWAAEDIREDYKSPVTGNVGRASIRNRMISFPPFLMIQLRRFYHADDWTAAKLDCLIEVPDELDLEFLRSSGLQNDEVLMAGEEEKGESQSGGDEDGNGGGGGVVADEMLVATLVSMGFSENASKRACIATANTNPDACVEWIIAHMEDSDISSPLPIPPPSTSSSPPPMPSASDFSSDSSRRAVNAENTEMLVAMGFTDKQAEAALIATEGDVNRAGDWLFSHCDNLEEAVEMVKRKESEKNGKAKGEAETTEGAEVKGEMIDGTGRYELVGFISHLGKNANCGHYVCHIKKDGRWVIFNDCKVAASRTPPLDSGYLYLFKRKEC